MNPLPPRLYGLPKLHKPNIPIRPVVSYNSAPAYKLTHKVNQILRDTVNFNPKYSIKNSLDLIEKIKDVQIPLNAKIVSFDVCNLFPSVPTIDCKIIVDDMLHKKLINPTIISDINHTLSTCLNQNYFKYNDQFYKQCEGLAMGSPLSPILAEIFMDNFEDKLFSISNNVKYVKYWHRYVDDVLCLWTGSKRQLDLFFQLLNSQHKSIKFTMESGDEGNLNFLDLNIDISNGKHNFKIYRKPTYSDAIIPSSSRHPISHKHAIFHSLLHRLINVPLSSVDYKLELNTIKTIAVNNGYPTHLIDNLLRKKIKNKNMHLIYAINNLDRINKKWVRLSFIGSTTIKITNKINKSLYKPTYYCQNNLGKYLLNNKDKVDTFDNSGVYQLNCNNCECLYIGQSGRSVKTRVKEHISSWKNAKDNSNFANHLLEQNHNFDPNVNCKLLHQCTKGSKLDSLEALEINRHLHLNPSTVLNDQLFLKMSPLLAPLGTT